MTATDAKPDELLPLPAVSIRTGISVDRLRRLARPGKPLAGLLVAAGDRRFVRAADLEKVKELAATRR